MKSDSLTTCLDITKAFFNKRNLNIRGWWTSLTSKQQSNIHGVAVSTAIVLFIIVFFMTLSWFMDRSLYINDKHAYEDYLDIAPEMPHFREKYRIVKYSDKDFVIQHLVNDKWKEDSFGIGRWWSLSTARNSMWSKVIDEAEDWIHVYAQEVAEVIE